MQNNNPVGIQLPTIQRGLGGDTETQRHVGHGEDDNPVTGSDVFGEFPESALQDMVAVQEGHLGLGLEPDLVLGVGGEQVEGLDGEVEAAAVGVFPDAGAEGDQVGAGDVGGALHEGLAGVEDLVLVEPEAVAPGVRIGTFVRGVLHDVLQVVSDELEQLLEHCARLLLVQGSHPSSSSF